MFFRNAKIKVWEKIKQTREITTKKQKSDY